MAGERRIFEPVHWRLKIIIRRVYGELGGGKSWYKDTRNVRMSAEDSTLWRLSQLRLWGEGKPANEKPNENSQEWTQLETEVIEMLSKMCHEEKRERGKNLCEMLAGLNGRK